MTLVGVSKNSMPGISQIYSFNVILSQLLEQAQEVQVTRTWRERLLTLPWKPLIKVKTVIQQRPFPGYIVSKGNPNIIIMHPDTLKQIQHEMEQLHEPQ